MNRLLCGILLWAVWPLVAGASVSLEEAPAVLLARGAEAFAREDYASARQAWEEVHARLEGQALDKLQPLLAHARLKCGDPAAAAELAERWIARADRDDPRAALALGILFESKCSAGDTTAALRALERLESLPSCPDHAPLLRLRLAAALAKARQARSAGECLEPLMTPDLPAELVAEARARSLETALADAESVPEKWIPMVRRSLDALSRPDAEGARAADTAVAVEARALAAALERLDSADPELALRICRSLPSNAVLASRLRSAAATLVCPRRADSPHSGPAWASWRRELAGRALAEAVQAESSPDLTAGLSLRAARLLARLGRPREAWLLAETVACDPSQRAELRDAAFVCWTLAALALGKWEESLTLTRHHAELFPESPSSQDMLTLSAQAQAGAGRWESAILCLDTLLARACGPFVQSRARLARGNAHLRLRNFDAALADFSWLHLEGPDGPWRSRGRIWHLVTLATARRHEEVLAACARFYGDGCSPENDPGLEHRRILALRSLGRNPEAEAAALAWLDRNGNAPQAAELHLLSGCIAVERGDLASARARFGKLPAAACGPRAHAAFQLGRVLRAQEDWAALAEHFASYVEGGGPGSPRLSEALHWHAFALSRLSRDVEAEAVWLSALERFGNDPASPFLEPILSACLKRLPVNERRDWLGDRRSRARSGGLRTLEARLTLALAALERKAGRTGLASALVEQVAVELEDAELDPPALLTVAEADEVVRPGVARRRLERLLTLHPRSLEALEARLLMARLHATAGEMHECAQLLREAAALSGHPRLWLARLSHAEHLLGLGDRETAGAEARVVLGTKAARGRGHARALRVLARVAEELGRTEEALALHQRVFVLHASQPDLAGESYLIAARLLRESGREEAAHQTLQELAAQEGHGFALHANAAREQLAAIAPIESRKGNL